MNTSTKLLAAVLTVGGIAAIGCDEQQSPTVTTETKTTETRTANTSTGNSVADKTREAAHNVADAARDAGHSVADAARDAGHNTADATRDATNSASTQPAAGTADASNGIVAEVQDLYKKATDAINQGKLNDAQGYVDKLKGYRDRVPAEWQSRIDQLVSGLESAKARLNALPGVNNVPH